MKSLLEQAVRLEREQLLRDARMDPTDRQLREMQLGALPSSTAAAVSELADYDWASQQARQTYEQIKDKLGVGSDIELVRLALRQGLLTEPDLGET